MNITRFEIDGPLLISPRVFEDSRGYFMESYNRRLFLDETKIDTSFVQDNESFSLYGTLRGLHFQKPPFAQAKLVRAMTGTILDVVVDIRKGSPTFGRHISVELDSTQKKLLYIPRGFAHGFVVLSESATFVYKVDNYYAPEHDSGIHYADIDLNIDWKVKSSDLILSKKDTSLQSFVTYSKKPDF